DIVAAEVELLAQVAIGGKEGGAVDVGRPRLGILHTELELPRLRSPRREEGVTRLAVEPPRGGRVVGHAKQYRVANVVVARPSRGPHDELIPQVRTEVIVGKLVLPLPPTVSQRHAKAKVRGV